MSTREKFRDNPPPGEAVRSAILDSIRSASRKLTQPALESAVGARLGIPRMTVRAAVRVLLAEGELTYTCHFGCSFLESSFRRPVLISRRVVVKPPDCHYLPQPHEVVVSLAQGAAFGSGEHPSSRLAVRAIEHLAPSTTDGASVFGDTSVLDVGTGSGILVIVSVLLGIRHGKGIDIDACARSEAALNVRLNRLEDRVEISGESVDALQGPYSLITANLRAPTLARLADRLAGLSGPGGALVISGARPGEMADLQRAYRKRGFACRWRSVENDWGAMAFCR